MSATSIWALFHNPIFGRRREDTVETEAFSMRQPPWARHTYGQLVNSLDPSSPLLRLKPYITAIDQEFQAQPAYGSKSEKMGESV